MRCALTQTAGFCQLHASRWRRFRLWLTKSANALGRSDGAVVSNESEQGLRVQRIRIWIGLLCQFVCLLTANAHAQTSGYSVSIEGAPKPLREKLEMISELKTMARNLPTAAALRRAASNDVGAFKEAMKAAGYYNGNAKFRLEERVEHEGWQITFTIETGPAFKITDYHILYADAPQDAVADPRPQSLEQVNIIPNGNASGAALRDLQRSFLNALWERAYPAAEIISRQARADLDQGTATVNFVFKSGPHARFGGPIYTGLTRTNPKHLEKLVAWKEGEIFERSKLVAYRDRLAATGLFTSIDVAPGTPDKTGTAPVMVTLTERKNKTIGGGVSFSTTEGPGGRIFFENRNIFHKEERLRIEFEGSNIEQSATFNFNKPLPRFHGSGYTQFKFLNETTEAFNARSLTLSGGLKKQLIDDKLVTQAGMTLETSNIREDGREERTYFVSTPLSLLWNNEDSLLDPTKGVRASLTVRPYTGTDSFTQAEALVRTRVTFGPDKRLTAAFRSRLGASFNTSLADLPLNKRYFAGGGGSVRGFGFQEAGPLSADNDPTGGRSVIEGAFEGRVRMNKKIQLAGFIDAASVSSKRTPEFEGDYFVGIGGGVRYFTPIGPLRADIAFPLDKRITDSDFQFFISLGQAF